MHAVRALLLDLDKTLVNVEDHVDYCAAVASLRDQLDAIQAPPNVPETGWGRCAVEAMGILVALGGRPKWDVMSRRIEEFELAGVSRAEPMPGLAAFLEAVRAYPKAVVTLCGPRVTPRVLSRFSIAVDAVVARTPEHRIKPAPDQVEAALAALGASPAEAAMIGDSSWDRAAAEAAGVRFVGITNGRAPHEFGDATPVATGLAAALPLLLDEEHRP